MASLIRVELVQDSRVRVFVDGQATSSKGLARAVCFLAFLRGKTASRAAMAEALWPGEAPEVAAGRLRVTFTRLRSLLGPSLLTDRQTVRLAGAQCQMDLWEEEERIREALDEVDESHQLQKLKALGNPLRSDAWRDWDELDLEGSTRSWDEICRLALSRLADLAVKARDWKTVDSAWAWTLERGSLQEDIARRLLESHHARGTLSEGLKILRRIHLSDPTMLDADALAALRQHARHLQADDRMEGRFGPAHAQALGRAILDRVDRCAKPLSALLLVPDVQLALQASPALYLEILSATAESLEPDSAEWVGVQMARLSALASVYDDGQVIEVSRRLLASDLTPSQAASTWMYYSFSLFQLRQWEEALSAVKKAAQIALDAGETIRHEVCRLTEAAYLWHLGLVAEARAIYDRFLELYGESTDPSIVFNRAACLANYAIIEMVYGHPEAARQRVEEAYAERTRVNLSRIIPFLQPLRGVIFARTGDRQAGAGLAIEGLKLTHARGSSREVQLSMEWACGVLAVAGQKPEALAVMNWVNDWRRRTLHTRSNCEERYFESLGLEELADNPIT
ncbi:MAG: hypothetical protein MH204_00455, partial [Fimbriimonadaceae bacterium]|nr:hypothetical protein [Fimbriimonadaceae bacterium]